jgi:transposase
VGPSNCLLFACESSNWRDICAPERKSSLNDRFGHVARNAHPVAAAEAVKAGKMIERIALAFEAGRDGFWLARWLRARGIEVHVIHSTSVAVSR